ncbi:MAG: 30S ribosomal protein S8e [Aigarchaeota archaeon]|nr:30S ribosomal protein S8e [Candidatus Pelearchaeum maunauluense]
MVQWHGDLHKRKRTGGIRVPPRKKRRYERGGGINVVYLGDPDIRARRARGGNIKIAVRATKYANVADGSGRVQKMEIIRVVKNPSNRDYDRRKVITRGTIIETPAGQAVVTSRPGQDGVVNAVLIAK